MDEHKDEQNAEQKKDITKLIQSMIDGEADSNSLEHIYTDLHRIAQNAMRNEQKGHTFQPTTLVNEAYLRVFKNKGLKLKNRGHFFSTMATVMRHILVDHARAKNAKRRGGDIIKISLEHVDLPEEPDRDLLVLHDYLNLLAEIEPRQAKCVELRYFGGLTYEEIAEELGITSSTVAKDMAKARGWLNAKLSKKR